MPLIFVLFIVCFLLFVFLIHERLKLFQLFNRIGVPGPVPNFFVGNMSEMMGPGQLITDVMSEWESKYGSIYGYFRGTRATLVVKEPELIKDILVRKSANYINRPHMIIKVPPIHDTIVGMRGQQWKDVRQTLSPAFSGAKVKQMFSLMEDCVKTTISILEEKYYSGETEEDTVVDAYKLFQGFSCDVISACALAMKVNSQRDENDRFFVAVKGFLANAMGPFVKLALCFPLLAQLASWGLVRFGYSHEMTKMIMASVQQAMSLRRMNKQKSTGKPMDFLQLMMDARQPDINGNAITDALDTLQPALTDEQIVANAWVFILGGFETTSASLSYTCYILSIHQEIQEKLFLELKDTFTMDDFPKYDEIGELTYLDQVICESLRLFPPVVNFVVRGLEKDSWIGPYFIPNSVGIQIPVWQIHHDPDIWPEPYTFNPDRFENNAKKCYANNMQWIPFGNGPRSCIGARFAMLNMKFTLCSILRRFRIVPESQYIPYKLKLKVPSVTILPDGGLPLRFIPREQ